MTADPLMPDVAWYCVRSHVKRETVAARHLLQQPGLEVYAPRIRYRKSTRRGAVWFEEALFPGYLFARFDLATQGKAVLYTTGVTGLVRFSGRAARLEDSVLEILKASMQGADVKIFEETLKPGDPTVILDGPFRGLAVVVQQVLPAVDRVRVLFEFLGQTTFLEIERKSLDKAGARPPPSA
jgi:transcriptional antiterminator RfaH